ncbi:MAG: ABC transporter permease subunit/CPBP intramembrane protease [Planctomycetota bacterium]|jgi:sodium transport system permease protein
MDVTWRNVRLILLREVRDQLRDRRTLFMVLILPLLLYPGLGVGMMQMTMLVKEEARQVVVLGADQLPEPVLISDGRFESRWFRDPETATRLNVLTDLPDDTGVTSGLSAESRVELLDTAERLKNYIAERNSLVQQLAPWNRELADELPPVEAAALQEKFAQGGELAAKPAEIEQLEVRFDELTRLIAAEFTGSRMHVLVLVPPGFKQNAAEINTLLGGDEAARQKLNQLPLLRAVVVRNRADDKSEIAYRRTLEAVTKWERQLLSDRLKGAGLPQTVPDPVSLLSIDVASKDEIAASVWSRVFPALLVIMALTGAFYPAVDIAAGEKERGTMETLLICPATRSEIVVGKFFTVLIFSLTTTLLNLISMGFTGQYIVSVASGAAPGAAVMSDVALPTAMAILWMIVLLIPLAAFFSAISLALATFARSNKEGQYYLMPLFMVTIGMTMFSMSPTIELTAEGGSSLFYCAMPIVGPTLLLKALLLNPGDTGILVFALPVLMSSVGYSMIALWWAVEQFKSEDVLFREAERFNFKAWIHYLLRDKEETPTSGEAAACFILMMLLQFLSIRFLGNFITGVTPENLGIKVMQLAVVSQIALMAAPALLMAVLLTSSFRKTLKLTLPDWKILGMAVILPLVLHPLAIEVLSSLKQFFPDLPESAKVAFAAMSDTDLPLLIVIAVFALTPAICEEVAFRGFILTGFSRGNRVGSAIVLSSVMFGIIHMVPQQVFNATLLGLVLGLLAVRSGSLLPGIVFHLIFNSLAVLHGQAGGTWSEQAPEWLDSHMTGWFVSLHDGMVRYGLPTLVICAVIAFILIRYLIRLPRPADSVPTSSPQPTLTATPAS